MQTFKVVISIRCNFDHTEPSATNRSAATFATIGEQRVTGSAQSRRPPKKFDAAVRLVEPAIRYGQKNPETAELTEGGTVRPFDLSLLGGSKHRKQGWGLVGFD